ncbi:MAG: transposase [Lachnospiraceae bacterium]|nr:transposase [Lachnospiraceae bacterium]
MAEQYKSNRRQIGLFSPAVVKALKLNIAPGTPIFISDTNIEHMKTSHPADFQKYGRDIADIIACPDYVGRNAADGSIEFTKEYRLHDEFVKVAVRVSLQNIFYARSLYVLNQSRVQNFITKGTLIKPNRDDDT